jgi:hypothetical protein
MDHNQAMTLKLMTDIANSMTNKQRKKAVKRLRNVADDWRALTRATGEALRPLNATRYPAATRNKYNQARNT